MIPNLMKRHLSPSVRFADERALSYSQNLVMDLFGQEEGKGHSLYQLTHKLVVHLHVPKECMHPDF